jgi:ABC-type Fe3+ transport system permease subunit
MESFQPLRGGTASALLGTGGVRDDLYSRRIHGPEEQETGALFTIGVIVLSAIIFVTVVAIYDVIRNLINNYYSALALRDPRSGNSAQDIESALIANYNTLVSSAVFALVCIILALIVGALLVLLLWG